jgi:phosphoadenosine phosphosulfate reductase
VRALERVGYLAHARSGSFARHLAEARETVQLALAEHPGQWAVGCSGGKDSTALLALCVEAGWRGPLFHFYYPETPAENTALVLALGARFDLPVQTLAVPGAFDVYEQVGHFFTSPQTPEERAATAAMLRAYKQLADKASTAYVGLFWGLRAGESAVRRFTLARKGACYRTLDRNTWTCCPLRRWSGRDVWAFLVSRDLPWLPRYDAAAEAPDGEGRELQRSEVTWLAVEVLWGHGQAARIRAQEPALWARLVERFPDLAHQS